MRLRTNKTYSQHELAVKLNLQPPPSRWMLSQEQQHTLIHAAKTAIAAALCWWIAKHIGLPDGYWGSISTVIVLQSNVGSTVTASRDRILGTIIGAIIGFACSLCGVLPWNYIAAVLLAILTCGLLGFKNSSRLAGVTICIVMLVQAPGPRWELALYRVLEVALGILVALAVSTLVIPDRARKHLRDGLAQEFLVLAVYFEATLEGFRGVPSTNLDPTRADVRRCLRENDQYLAAARNEPSGGNGWREALGMLSQFGRGLFDAILALELSVEGSHKDGFVQQLEPELGKLAVDIQTGFHHVARCIHEWRFDVPPPNMNLEHDIAELEARMDSVRHKGIGFSQAEILRAYAVQLHLKQIARMLRASRIETGLAFGEEKDKNDECVPLSD